MARRATASSVRQRAPIAARSAAVNSGSGAGSAGAAGASLLVFAVWRSARCLLALYAYSSPANARMPNTPQRRNTDTDSVSETQGAQDRFVQRAVGGKHRRRREIDGRTHEVREFSTGLFDDHGDRRDVEAVHAGFDHPGERSAPEQAVA